MATFDDLIDKAVADGGLPGVVLFARDKDGKNLVPFAAWDSFFTNSSAGKLDYAKAAGAGSLEPGNEQAMQLDSVLRLASSTKLLTTIAVLQAVERGLVGLDDDVSAHVPVLARQEVLAGFTWYGKPLTHPRRKAITLRHLLTHTVGAGYDFLPIYSSLWWWRWWYRQAAVTGAHASIDERYAYPLLHEPGDGWTYGSGAAWAGKVLEAVAGVTLDTWVKENIGAPLGAASLTFFPSEDDGLASRLTAVSQRNTRTGKLDYLADHCEPEWASECMGGEGAYSSLRDFMAVLHSLLLDDGKLLTKESTALMFTPQLTDAEKPSLWDCLDRPIWICSTILKKGEYDWGMGGVLIDGDGHEYLGNGTLMWTGLYHLLWVSNPIPILDAILEGS